MSRPPHFLLAIAALPALLGGVACGGSTTGPVFADRTALLHAESQWSAAAIHDYDYDLVTSFAAAHDSVQVQVRGGQIVLSQSYLSGRASSAGKTVPGLFSAIDAAITSGMRVDVAYDPQLGYPATGTISSQINTPGGPSSWRMVNFARMP